MPGLQIRYAQVSGREILSTERYRSSIESWHCYVLAMAGYIVYINSEQLGVGTEQSVNATMARCGFKRAIRRHFNAGIPLPTLLYVGQSSYSERHLSDQLEKVAQVPHMSDIQVLIFRANGLRSRRTGNPTYTLQPVSKYIN